MKKSYLQLILILLIACSAFPSALAQVQSYPETVYRHRAKFPRIFRTGELASAVQLCDPKSVCVGTGLFIMKKASVGEVKKCVLYLYVVKDTIQSCRIDTRDEKETQALYRQVIKEFGEPVEEGMKNGQVWYKWPDEVRNGKIVTTTLVITGERAEFRHWHEETNAVIASDRSPG